MITRRGAGGSGRGGGGAASGSGAATVFMVASIGPVPCAAAAAAAITGPGVGAAGVAEACIAGAAGGLAPVTAPGTAMGRSADAAGGAAAAMGGRTTTGPAGGREAMAGVCGGAATTPVRDEPAGAATIAGAWRGWGTTNFLGAGFASAAGPLAVGGVLGTAVGGAAVTGGFAVMGAAGAAGTTGFAAAGAGADAGRAGAPPCISCCFFSRIALATSPTLWTFDQSIFGLTSASCRGPAEVEPPRPFKMWVRTRSASSVSIELECVFFSVTPTAVRASRISLLLTSSSRANSLIRTVLIRPRSYKLPTCP